MCVFFLRMQIEPTVSLDEKQVIKCKEEKEEFEHVKKEIKLEIEEGCIDIEIDGEESTSKPYYVKCLI